MLPFPPFRGGIRFAWALVASLAVSACEHRAAIAPRPNAVTLHIPDAARATQAVVPRGEIAGPLATPSARFAHFVWTLSSSLINHDVEGLSKRNIQLSDAPNRPPHWSPLSGTPKLDWVLVDLSLAALNPMSDDVTLDASIHYSKFVFPDGSARLFMMAWRGSGGSAPRENHWPSELTEDPVHDVTSFTSSERSGCGLRSLREEELQPLDLETTAGALLPFAVARVRVDNPCGALRGSIPPMPLTGWLVQDAAFLVSARNSGKRIIVGGVLEPAKEGPASPMARLIAFDAAGD